MNTFKTRVEYEITDASVKTYSFPFPYLRKEFIKVSILHTDNTITALTYGVDYSVDDLSITLVTAPSVSEHLIIYRETTTDRIITWNDGSILLAKDMNTEDAQMLHLQEEQQDYLTANALATSVTSDKETIWSALNHRITDVFDPKEEQDVVTKHYMETVQGGFVSQNTALVEQATTQATNAKNSASNAKTSETNAASSATKANTSNISAKAWAMSSDSPDGASDSQSSTGKTQSSKSWALQAENRVKNIDFYMMNMLQRNKVYEVGDIAFSPLLKSYYYLECTVGGKTASTTPSISGKNEGNTFTDGAVTWKVCRDASRDYIAEKYLPLTGGKLTGELDINANNKGIDIQETTMSVTNSTVDVYTDLIRHVGSDGKRFCFFRSGKNSNMDTFLTINLINESDNPLDGIRLYRKAATGQLEVQVYGKEIKNLFYPYTDISGMAGGFTRYDGFQLFYAWIQAGASYTYPKPFSDIPRVFTQGIMSSVVLNNNISKTVYTNNTSSDVYVLVVGKGV